MQIITAIAAGRGDIIVEVDPATTRSGRGIDVLECKERKLSAAILDGLQEAAATPKPRSPYSRCRVPPGPDPFRVLQHAANRDRSSAPF